jgi:hypothetical protein
MLSYEFIAGLLFGAGVGGHALRLVTLDSLKGPRAFIAWSAMVIYGLGVALCLFEQAAGLYIAIVFPVVGVSAVLLTKNKVDAFQRVLGVFQLVALFASALRLLSGAWLLLGP